MNLSYSAVWDDTVALIRSHASLLVAVAGAFIFLPGLLIGYLLPAPEAAAQGAEVANQMLEYLRSSWPWLLLRLVVLMLGTLTILILLFDRDRPTVAGAIAGALPILPFYVLAYFLSGILIFGVMMLVAVPLFLVLGRIAPYLPLVIAFIPVFYLYARLAPLAPVIVAEKRRNPVDALRRCFEITARKGWAIFGLLLLVLMAALFVTLAISAVAGLVFVLLLGRELGQFLMLVLGTALEAIVTTLVVLLIAALYRHLTAGGSTAAAFD